MADNKSVNEIQWRITTKDDSATGLDSFRRRVQQTASQTQPLGSGGSAGGWLESMAARARSERLEKRQTGEMALMQTLRSPEGIVDFGGDLLGVGLRLGVADLLGRGLASATDNMIKFRNELEAGTLTAEQLERNLAKSIPVLGNFVGFFLNVRELLTGEEAAIAKITREAETQNAVWRVKRDLLREQISLQDKHEELMRRLATEGEATRLGGIAGQRYAERQQRIEDLQPIHDEKTKRLAEINQRMQDDKVLNDLRKQRDTLNAKEFELNRTLSYPDVGGSGRGYIRRDLAQVVADRDRVNSQIGSVEKSYADQRAAVTSTLDAKARQIEENNKIKEEADAREHQRRMDEIEDGAIKSRYEKQAALFRDDRMAVLKAQYDSEQALLARHVGDLQKEYARLASLPTADEYSKQETLAQIGSAKERVAALDAKYKSDATQIERDRADRQMDETWQREDAQARINRIEAAFRQSQMPSPKYTFPLEQTDPSELGISKFWNSAEKVDKQRFEADAKVREYLKQLVDAAHDQSRMMRQQSHAKPF